MKQTGILSKKGFSIIKRESNSSLNAKCKRLVNTLNNPRVLNKYYLLVMKKIRFSNKIKRPN